MSIVCCKHAKSSLISSGSSIPTPFTKLLNLSIALVVVNPHTRRVGALNRREKLFKGLMRQDIRNCSNISVDMSGVEENIANGISVSDAVEIVQDSDTTLVLDCRPFIAFNDSHIINALNVYCPPILKRRSNGFVSLENIVTCERRRRQLQDGHYLRVLCYDTDTEDLTQSGKDSNLYAVLKSLRQQVDISQICYIIG